MKGIQTILVGKCFRDIKDGRDTAIVLEYDINHIGGFYRIVAAKSAKALPDAEMLTMIRAAVQRYKPIEVYADIDSNIVGQRFGINDDDKILPIIPNAKAKVVERDFYAIKHLLEA